MSDWWAKKLQGDTPRGQSTPPQAPRRETQVVSPAQQNVHRLPVNYDNSQDALTTPRQASHQRNSGACPECNSGNYFSMNGGRSRCYDCGYPIVQSTSGVSAMSSDGSKPTPAVQVHGTNNFAPGQIIGRVG